MFNIYDLLTFTILVGLAMWWWHVSGQKQRVLKFAMDFCEERGYQLLDESLSFSRYRIIRDGLNRRFVCRAYHFDFSSNREDRHNGEIAINGRTIVQIMLETEQIEITDFP